MVNIKEIYFLDYFCNRYNTSQLLKVYVLILYQVVFEVPVSFLFGN